MLLDYLRIIARRWWLALLPLVIVIAWTVAGHQTPVVSYQVTMRFAAGLLPEQTPGVYNYDHQYTWLSSEYLANGLSDIVHTGLFAENVAARLKTQGLDIQPELLQAALASDQKQSIMVVYLTWGNADQAVQIGTAISSELVQNGTSYWPQLGDAKSNPVVALDKPTPVPQAAPLRDRFDVPIRVLIALVAGLALVFVAHLLDPFLREQRELERMGLPVIGRIPR
jgi:capsular polysaccharide biosynthesis protein